MLLKILLLSVYFFSIQSFQLQEGDLLFQDSDCGPFCDAIEKVTFGYQGSNLSHIGMVIAAADGRLQVIEAISDGVVITALDTFLNRSVDADANAKVIVGRINEEKQYLVPQAVTYAKSLLGKEYDTVFDITNDAYYCSELVYEAFKYANHDIPIFDLQAMTFVDPDTDSTFGIWTEYYDALGEEIPEGHLGLNPGGISTSPMIQIVHAYGVVSTK